MSSELIDSFYVIDVRSESEYNNGHIPNAVSFPSSQLTLTPKHMITETILNKLNHVNHRRIALVFHCHLSLIRGPSSATFVDETITKYPHPVIKFSTFLLEGGFKGYSRIFESEK